MRSIKWKLVVIYLLIVFIVMIVSGTFIVLRLDSLETQKAKDELIPFAQRISEQVVLNYPETDFQKGLKQFATSTAGISQYQGSILDKDGITIATTVTQQLPYPEYKNSSIVGALTGAAGFNSGEWEEAVSGLIKEWLCYALPVKDGDTVKYVVFVQMDISSTRDGLNKTVQTIVIAVILAIVLTSVIGLLFANTLTGPIAVLTKKAKEIARGKLNQEIVVKSNDEIGQLTRSFNYMAKELANTLSTITSEKNKLEIVLHNMTDGVLAFDNNGRLLHANSLSYEMLDIHIKELTLSFVLTKFNTKHDEIKVVNSIRKASCQIGDKYINSVFTPYSNVRGNVEGIIIVLQDITEQKRLDEMRKEFVANVSHELRTPLTTIKSYTETLSDGAINDKEIANGFLEIIDGEVDRMTGLVRDLLQLSRLDSKQLSFKLEKTYLNLVIEDNIRQTKILSEHKNQTLNYVKPTIEMLVNIDKDRINQVFNNIIINAIKYSPEGSTIEIYTGETNDYYKVYIKDNGIGIPKSDIPRIFERFYRVDKARSRQMGGTGLGLSISGEIMEGHGGKITAESEYGKGTVMTIWFLKNVYSPKAKS